jgi:nitrate/TMAO reductase-like tetraheme cytochrome c subunit
MCSIKAKFKFEFHRKELNSQRASRNKKFVSVEDIHIPRKWSKITKRNMAVLNAGIKQFW